MCNDGNPAQLRGTLTDASRCEAIALHCIYWSSSRQSNDYNDENCHKTNRGETGEIYQSTHWLHPCNSQRAENWHAPGGASATDRKHVTRTGKGRIRSSCRCREERGGGEGNRKEINEQNNTNHKNPAAGTKTCIFCHKSKFPCPVQVSAFCVSTQFDWTPIALHTAASRAPDWCNKSE